MSSANALSEIIGKEKIVSDQHLIDLQAAFAKRGVEDMLYLAYGETWRLAPPKLQALLTQADTMDNGYQLTSWGRPAYREILHKYIFSQHHLPESCDWQVGWSSNGTRAKMFDFGRLIKKASSKAPKAIFPLPSWDYQRVFSANGFEICTYELQPDNNFLPNIDDFHSCLRKNCGPGENHDVLVIVNAQHNPTGVNWPTALLRQYLGLALEFQCSILLDDAYFAVDSPADPASCALSILHDLTQGLSLKQPWLMVRSLGKQFACNGWGMGATVCSRETLEKMGDLAVDHTYGYGGVWQSAMCKWLAMPDSAQFVQEFRSGLVEKKAYVQAFFKEQTSYAAELLYASTCSPYYMLRVPPKFLGEERPNRAFLLDALNNHGVVVAPANMSPSSSGAHRDWIRLYLGAHMHDVQQACGRLAAYQW